MKLHADHIVFAHNGGKIEPVIGIHQHFVKIGTLA